MKHACQNNRNSREKRYQANIEKLRKLVQKASRPDEVVIRSVPLNKARGKKTSTYRGVFKKAKRY